MTGIEVLERAMKRRGFDELKLAKASGVHVTLIRRWFGRYGTKATHITPANAKKIAAVLGVSPDWLVFGKRSAA